MSDDAFNYLAGHTDEAPRPRVLTRQMLLDAVESARQAAVQHARSEARRMEAWANLRLDYDAMTDAERYLIFYAQSMPIVSPDAARRIEAVVAKYRRDSPAA